MPEVFRSVGADLRSISDTSVFVAGDAAHLQGQERAKAGVYAVRAAPVLAHNLALAVQGKPLTGSSSRFKGPAILSYADWHWRCR